MHRLPRAFRLRQQNLTPSRLNKLSQRRFESQYIHKTNGEPIRLRSVRLKGPGLTLRRLATIGLYTGAVFAYITLVTRTFEIELETLDDDEEQEGEDGEGEDEDGEYAEDDSLFIPMTWATKMPRTYYKGSDPEWQEFIKVAKDKKRHGRIQNELVQIVFKETQAHKSIGQQLGKDYKIGKFWLDISFPDGPPQEFERSGIEIGDGYIAWSRERISPESQWRLMRALWPKAAFDSLWATSKVLVGINYRRAKQALGWEEKDPFSPEERYKHAVEMMEKQQQTRERKEVGKAQTDPEGNPSTTVATSGNTGAQSSRPAGDEPKRFPWQIQVPMPPTSATNTTDIPIAMSVFQSTLSKQWNPKKMEPPRGSFVVQGMVELRGSRGRMLFDVQSCYDPKLNKFVVISAAMRNYKRWNQSPRGGP